MTRMVHGRLKAFDEHTYCGIPVTGDVLIFSDSLVTCAKCRNVIEKMKADPDFATHLATSEADDTLQPFSVKDVEQAIWVGVNFVSYLAALAGSGDPTINGAMNDACSVADATCAQLSKRPDYKRAVGVLARLLGPRLPGATNDGGRDEDGGGGDEAGRDPYAKRHGVDTGRYGDH